MTGGQPHDGELSVVGIAQQLRAEGVSTLVVVSDEPKKYPGLPRGVSAHHRDEFDGLQRRMRGVRGTSIIIYDQTCAAEKRRRRKRNEYPDPDRRIIINQAVCEGCGDCGVQSNCIAIVPVETEFGRKRAIDQSACNKDFSCTNGFCPSFVSISGAKPRGSNFQASVTAARIADPVLPCLERGYALLITGIGGTGVVTISAMLGMAARLEQKGCVLLDMTGLAQKGGIRRESRSILIQPAFGGCEPDLRGRGRRHYWRRPSGNREQRSRHRAPGPHESSNECCADHARRVYP